jgi:5-methylcytosine-specific restriction endonuclease McrA
MRSENSPCRDCLEPSCGNRCRKCNAAFQHRRFVHNLQNPPPCVRCGSARVRMRDRYPKTKNPYWVVCLICRLIIENNRRAKKRNNGGKGVTPKEWKILCRIYQNRCLRCGESKPLTMDHVIPLARDGKHELSNIQPLCLPCNSWKGNRVIMDYRRKLVEAFG